LISLVQIYQKLLKKKPPLPPADLPCSAEIWNHASEPFGDKLLVVASFHQNLDWVCSIRKYKIPHIIYTRDNPSNKYNVIPNNGNEASVYLKFIIDHFDRLPNMTAFVHGHRNSWHTSRDIDDILINLRWHDHSYMDFNVGHGFPRWQEAHPKTSNGDHRVIREQWNEFYKEYLGEMPDQLNFYCCAQFAVSRERIHLHPVQFYKQLYEFVLHERIPSYFSSRLLEYTWSYIFGEPSNRSQYPNDCYYLRC